ncbi:MAG: hypothetical protein IPM17_06755 [Verrucomicrobia bacterium]|nr:hypothetical protein [Verrucomicrobiota bacterium]
MKRYPVSSSSSSSRRGLAAAWAVAVAASCSFVAAPGLRAQTDDFNDGNDAGWSRFDLALLGLNGAQYSFPADSSGGRAYRIYAPPPVVDVGAPALAISYTAPLYTRFVIGVDVLNWATGVNQAFGIFARAAEIGFPTIDGYVMNYNVADGDLQINEITDVAGQNTRAELAVALDPRNGPYRWVFSGYENNFLGQVFRLPDTVNPIASVIGSGVIGYDRGQSGLFVFNRDGNVTAPTSFADATFDNFAASAPPPGSLRATVFELQPTPGGVARTIPAAIKVAIVDRETAVDPGSVQLTVDGQVIPSSALTVDNEVVVPNTFEPFPGVTVRYTAPAPANLAGVHTNRVTFRDHTGFTQTHEWTYSYAYLKAAHALPPGSGRNPGFSVRLVQSIQNQPLPNSLARAEQQLATPPQIPVDLTTNTTAPVINFTQKLVPDNPPSADGHFEDAATFPGIDPFGNTDDIAMEVLAYLELPAGAHTFGVTSDDGFELRSGASFTDPDALVLGAKTSGTFDGTFDVIAETAGLYPFRLVWFERGGGAHVELFTLDPASGERVLVNDLSQPRAIRAFRDVVRPQVKLQAAAAVNGPYADDPAATVNEQTRTITTSASGATRFYRLVGGAALRFKTVALEGTQLTMTYE